MIDLPRPDDRRFADFVSAARAQIPTLTTEWTDHNPTDPGITLIELFAWLAEVVLYRTGRIPDSSYSAFLRLLTGPSTSSSSSGPDARPLAEVIRTTLAPLREQRRAVTAADFERLARAKVRADLSTSGAPGPVRVRCLPGQSADTLPNAWKDARPQKGEGHVTLIVASDRTIVQTALDSLSKDLEQRRLISTRVHVLPCLPLPLMVSAELYLRMDGKPKTVLDAATQRLTEQLAAVDAAGGGWPFDRPVYNSDLLAALDGVPGVDFVENAKVKRMNESRLGVKPDPMDASQAIGVSLQPDELPELKQVDLRLFRRRGGRWLQVVLPEGPQQMRAATAAGKV